MPRAPENIYTNAMSSCFHFSKNNACDIISYEAMNAPSIIAETESSTVKLTSPDAILSLPNNFLYILHSTAFRHNRKD